MCRKIRTSSSATFVTCDVDCRMTCHDMTSVVMTDNSPVNCRSAHHTPVNTIHAYHTTSHHTTPHGPSSTNIHKCVCDNPLSSQYDKVLSESLTPYTTFIVLKFLTLTPNLLSHYTSRVNTRQNPGNTAERNMNNPRTRTRTDTSFMLLDFMRPWLIAGWSPVTHSHKLLIQEAPSSWLLPSCTSWQHINEAVYGNSVAHNRPS